MHDKEPLLYLDQCEKVPPIYIELNISIMTTVTLNMVSMSLLVQQVIGLHETLWQYKQQDSRSHIS